MRRNPTIEKAIELAGGSQAKLAKKAGLSQQFISKLLLNKKCVSINSAAAIAEATGHQLTVEQIAPSLVKNFTTKLSGFASAKNEALAQ